MKILTVCEGGNVRSVSCAFILKFRRGMKDVLACGIMSTGAETWEMLGNWADKIIICGQGSIIWGVPSKFSEKFLHLNIGQDRWGNPFNPELLQILDDKLKENNL